MKSHKPASLTYKQQKRDPVSKKVEVRHSTQGCLSSVLHMHTLVEMCLHSHARARAHISHTHAHTHCHQLSVEDL